MTLLPKSLRRWAALGLLAYIGLPYALVQVANLGLVREGKRARREVALTFDDGPDPASTPAILDALAAAGAKATFFVLLPKAEAHPELLARILAESHEVEAHAAQHRHAWLRSPWGAYRDPIQAVRRLEQLTGQRPKFHRPPHGAYTLATLLGQRAAGVTGAHWSIEAHDWHAAYTPGRVRERLGRLLVPGAVVVLHDAEVGAKNTVPMLPALLADLKARGYQSVRLDELEGATPQDWPFLKRRAFALLDSLFDRAGGIHWAGQRHDNLFRVGKVAFPLEDTPLADNRVIAKGSPVLEFHVNNALLVDMGPRRSVRQAPADFADVARELQDNPKFADVQAIFCLSALSPLLGLLKFENYDLTPHDARRLRRWANVLRRAYGNEANAGAPRLSILSRDTFLRLYGNRSHGDSMTK